MDEEELALAGWALGNGYNLGRVDYGRRFHAYKRRRKLCKGSGKGRTWVSWQMGAWPMCPKCKRLLTVARDGER